MKMQFNDGESFDIDGPYRIEERFDGYYVVGRGMLMAVKDEEEGRGVILALREGR